MSVVIGNFKKDEPISPVFAAAMHSGGQYHTCGPLEPASHITVQVDTLHAHRFGAVSGVKFEYFDDAGD